MSSAKYCLEKIIHKLLHRCLGGQQPREVDLGHKLAAALVVLQTVAVMPHQVPHLNPWREEINMPAPIMSPHLSHGRG